MLLINLVVLKLDITTRTNQIITFLDATVQMVLLVLI
jgi:hypothetical protein